jgi:hypothetical protein
MKLRTMSPATEFTERNSEFRNVVTRLAERVVDALNTEAFSVNSVSSVANRFFAS